MNGSVTVTSVVMVAGLLAPAAAQLSAPNDVGVSIGHLHLNARNVQDQKKFWVDVMGARIVRVGPIEALKLSGILVMLHEAVPTGGTKGSVINHVGFRVRDLHAAVARMKAAGANFVTRTEVSGGRATEDIFRNEAQNQVQAFVMGPDEVKIELIEDPTLSVPLASHHIHFYHGAPAEAVAWYVKVLGAKGGKRGPFDAADVPGVNLSFTNSGDPVLGTKGRSLDHIGFEVRNLEAFCKRLTEEGVKFDVPYRRLPGTELSIAFLTDPWGAYIELTEGLSGF